MTNFKTVNIGDNDLSKDAWGKPKVTEDVSILHGMFTYNVPVSMWEEHYNGLVVPFTNATSVDGKLRLEAGNSNTDNTYLHTFRNPRYQPNRGHIYSSSMFLPNPGQNGERRFGYFTAQSGAFFLLNSLGLFAVVRTTVGGVTTDYPYPIDITGLDLEKGNTFDIQMQWRGVGNIKFFINFEEVVFVENLGIIDRLSMFNPANPIAFECINLGDNVALECGCVDISTEGGEKNGKTYGSVGVETDTGEAAFTGINQPLLAFRSKLDVNGLINTRDMQGFKASAYADEKCLFRVWTTRDFSAITEGNSSWMGYGDGHSEYIYMNKTSGTLSFDTSKASPIFTCRIPKENTYETSALFEGHTEIHITPGDMLILTLHRETLGATKGGCNLEFGEEI